MLRLVNSFSTRAAIIASTNGDGPSLGSAGLNGVLEDIQASGRQFLLKGLNYVYIAHCFRKAAAVDPLRGIVREKQLAPALHALRNVEKQWTSLLYLVSELGDEYIPAEVGNIIWSQLQQNDEAEPYIVDMNRQLDDISAGSFILRANRPVTPAEWTQLRILPAKQLGRIAETSDMKIIKGVKRILAKRAINEDVAAKEVLAKLSLRNYALQIRLKMETGKNCRAELMSLFDVAKHYSWRAVFSLDDAVQDGNVFHAAAHRLFKKMIHDQAVPPWARVAAIDRLLTAAGLGISDLDIQRAIRNLIACGSPAIKRKVFSLIIELPGPQPVNVLKQSLDEAVANEIARAKEDGERLYRDSYETRWPVIHELTKSMQLRFRLLDKDEEIRLKALNELRVRRAEAEKLFLELDRIAQQDPSQTIRQAASEIIELIREESDAHVTEDDS